MERRQEWAKGNRSSCRHHHRAVQPMIQNRKSRSKRLRLRPAGQCTARVGALRPTASRYPAFLSHPNAPLSGFTGFSTRAVSREF